MRRRELYAPRESAIGPKRYPTHGCLVEGTVMTLGFVAFYLCIATVVFARVAPCTPGLEGSGVRYPGRIQLVSEAEDVLLSFRIAMIERVYHTQDDATTVRDWYETNVADTYIFRRAQSALLWEVEPIADGTRITLLSACGVEIP